MKKNCNNCKYNTEFNTCKAPANTSVHVWCMANNVVGGNLCPDEADGCPGWESATKLQTPAKYASAVDHPAHYGGADNTYEAIKVIEAWGLDFCLGNVVKYISRAGKKSDKIVEDLEKAQWYLQRRIQQLKGK